MRDLKRCGMRRGIQVSGIQQFRQFSVRIFAKEGMTR